MLSLSDDRTFVGQASGGGEVDRAEAIEMLESALGDRPGSRVAVFGGAWTGEDEPDYASARRFGKELAAQGIEVVCGGYQGIMAAVCRGAADAAAGATYGITVAPWVTRAMVNEWVDHVVEARDPLRSAAGAGGCGRVGRLSRRRGDAERGVPVLEPGAERSPPPRVRWWSWGTGGPSDRGLREQLVVAGGADFDLVTHAEDADQALEAVSASVG